MTTPPEPLPDDLDAAHRLIRELFATLLQQIHLNEKLQHQREQLLRQRYGRKGERVDPDQLLLFAREILAQAELEDPASDPGPGPTPAPTRPKGHGHGRKPLPTSLPRKRVVHEVPSEQRLCPDCGAERRPIGVLPDRWKPAVADPLLRLPLDGGEPISSLEGVAARADRSPRVGPRPCRASRGLPESRSWGTASSR